MAVKHSTVAISVDEEGAEVNKAEWNDDHVVGDGSFTIAKTTGLQTAIDGKQATISTGDLAIADTSGLQTAIDGKIDDSQVLTDVPSGAVFTDTVYTHPSHTGDVTGSGALTISGGAVDIAHLSATGTADATTYLRGDNSWQTIAAGGATVTTQKDTNTSGQGFTTTSFVASQLSITLANRSGGKAMITAALTVAVSDPGSMICALFDDGVLIDGTAVNYEGSNNHERSCHLSHVMDLDGSVISVRCRRRTGTNANMPFGGNDRSTSSLNVLEIS